MKELPISLIIPCYNAEKYLFNLFENIKAIYFKNYEVIFVDDCSTDNTLQLLKTFAEKNSQLYRVIHLEKNGGLSNARFVGLSNSTNMYVLFLDSDDLIDKYYLKVFSDGYLKIPSADIYVNSMIRIKNNEKVLMNSFQITTPMKLESSEALTYLVKDVKISSFFQNKLFNKNFLLLNYKIINKPFEDIFVMHNLFYKCNYVVALDNPQYYYFIHPNSLSTKKSNYIYGYLSTRSRLEFLIEINRKDLINFQSINLLKTTLQLFSIDKNYSKQYFKYDKKIYKHTLINDESVNLKLKLFIYFNFRHLYSFIVSFKKRIKKQ